MNIHAEILGHRMSWAEQGEGDPIVFVHGAPLSSYMWRTIGPALSDVGRCIAPDLIGFGASEKLTSGDPRRYAFDRQRRFFDALLAHLGVTDHVVLVAQGSGGMVALDWANRHRDAVKGLCYMECVVRPLAWSDVPASVVDLLRDIRSDAGEDLVLRQNIAIQRGLEAGMLSRLGLGDRRAYSRPFKRPGEDRRPLLAALEDIPIDGVPAAVATEVESYGSWLRTTEVPKLLVIGDPGFLLTGELLAEARRLPEQEEVTVAGVHFLPEDSGEVIAQELRRWYLTL